MLNRIIEPAYKEACQYGLGYISDIVLQAHSAPYLYVSRSWEVPSATFLPELSDLILTPAQIDECVRELKQRNTERTTLARQEKDTKDLRDFAFNWPSDDAPLWRIRANRTEVSRGAEVTLRIHPYTVPDFSELSLPSSILSLMTRSSGLIVVAGPTGGGKSTTIASLVRFYSERSNGRISTLEDPIEFLFDFPGRLISQQWVPVHVPTWADGIHDSLRRKVDLLVLGEMRDKESIEAAVHAACSGHLVIASCHPHTAVHTLEYLKDRFPPDSQDGIRNALLSCLLCVVCQNLLPSLGERPVVPWYEVLVMSDSIRANLANKQFAYLDSILSTDTYAREGNVSGRSRLDDLKRMGLISSEVYLSFAAGLGSDRDSLSFGR